LLRRFPHGSCGEASYLLAAYLIDAGITDLQRVVARLRAKPFATHVWLHHRGAIIDITAGQFEDAPRTAVVASSSPWHQKMFEIYDVEEPDFRGGNPQGFDLLHGDYDLMREYLL
jgi:hypothetical protein